MGLYGLWKSCACCTDCISDLSHGRAGWHGRERRAHVRHTPQNSWRVYGRVGVLELQYVGDADPCAHPNPPIPNARPRARDTAVRADLRLSTGDRNANLIYAYQRSSQ